MCGIFGYLGSREAAPILLCGLKQLEYRGYDSAGVALIHPSGTVEVTRSTERLAGLEAKLGALNGHARASRAGIGHTRWATHGRASVENAHPHTSLDGKIAVVHNGIFENFMSIRLALQARGHAPRTETDTECFPLLVSQRMAEGDDYATAFITAVRSMRGKYALACVHADHPNKILLARSGPPLVVGVGQGEYFVASDVGPLLPYTRDVVFLEDGDLGEVTSDGLRIWNRDGERVERRVQRVNCDHDDVELGAHAHFMHKEITEQPEAVSRTVEAYLRGAGVSLDLPFSEQLRDGVDRVAILACGTSWHAGLVAKFLLEQIARVPVEVDYASEFRYRDPLVSSRTLAIAITQSGETADTVAALEEARAGGARTVAICNSAGSQVTRLADGTLLTHAGREMGVASTKAFTTQLAVLTLVAVHLGLARGTVPGGMAARVVKGLRALPEQIRHVVDTLERPLAELAQTWHGMQSAMYLGRGALYPIALEGALKLKEISYIQAQGYPAGEMKHGPIALIDARMPVFALLPRDAHRERMLSNLQEVAARGAPIVAFTSHDEDEVEALTRTVVRLPEVDPILAPLLYTVPLQLFAYHVAVLRGCDVDRPRNLAKSVTVE